MLALSSLLLAGGVAYTGSLVYNRLNEYRKRLPLRRGSGHAHRIEQIRHEQNAYDKSLAHANHTLTISSLSLGVTVAGVMLKPMLMVISVPAALFIFAPTLQQAWQTLRQDRRITPPVLDATRVALCILMGYYFALALDTWLRTLTERLLMRTEAEFQHALDQYFAELSPSVWCYTSGAEVETPLSELAVGDIISIAEGELIPADGIVRNGVAWVDERLVVGNIKAVRKTIGDTVFASTFLNRGQIHVEITAFDESALGTAAIRTRLEGMTQLGSHLADAGERSGYKMAPFMGALFALLLPFWEANRAGGFLTTSFGNQMGRLGPYTLQNFAKFAMQHQILIYDGRALETLNLVNTIVIEAEVLNDPFLREQAAEAIAALRQRRWLMQEAAFHRFAIYLMADGDETAAKLLTDALGMDDYFVEPLAMARAALLERLQKEGRLICHIGSGAEDPIVTEKALVSVAIPTVGAHSSEQMGSTSAHVVLVEKNLNRLVQLFDIAARFGASQGVNLAWPLLMDFMDIGTTVFIHLGLTYSILFSYSGLLGSALYTRIPLNRQKRKQDRKVVKPIAPDRQIGRAAYL